MTRKFLKNVWHLNGRYNIDIDGYSSVITLICLRHFSCSTKKKKKRERVIEIRTEISTAIGSTTKRRSKKNLQRPKRGILNLDTYGQRA